MAIVVALTAMTVTTVMVAKERQQSTIQEQIPHQQVMEFIHIICNPEQNRKTRKKNTSLLPSLAVIMKSAPSFCLVLLLLLEPRDLEELEWLDGKKEEIAKQRKAAQAQQGNKEGFRVLSETKLD
ncbi:hypothetical protein ACLOJK_015530 [Asimina triloba]